MSRSEFKVVYQPYPPVFDIGKFDEVCGIAFQTGNLMLGVEETWHFATKDYIPLNYDNCINLGRMEGIAVVSISPRCAMLHNNVIAQSRHTFLFFTKVKPDHDWLRSFVDAEAVARLPKLEPYWFIYTNGADWWLCSPVEISPSPKPPS